MLSLIRSLRILPFLALVAGCATASDPTSNQDSDFTAHDGGAPHTAPGLTLRIDGVTWTDDEAHLLTDHIFGGGGAATGDSYVGPTPQSLDKGFLMTLKADSGLPYLTKGRYLCDTAGKPFSGERLPLYRSYFDLSYNGHDYAVVKDGSCVLDITSDEDGPNGEIRVVGTLTGEVDKDGHGPVPIYATFDFHY